MGLEPKSLNIKFPPSKMTWKDQRFFILAYAAISLFVIAPASILGYVLAVVIGTPLFWFVIGSNLIQRYTTNKPIIGFLLRLVLFYFSAKLLIWLVTLITKTFGGS